MLLRLVEKIRKNGEQNNNHSVKDEHGGEGRCHSNVKTKGRKGGEQSLICGKVEREFMANGLSLLRRFKRPAICVQGRWGPTFRGFKRAGVGRSCCG